MPQFRKSLKIFYSDAGHLPDLEKDLEVVCNRFGYTLYNASFSKDGAVRNLNFEKIEGTPDSNKGTETASEQPA